jgi:hypothetical protein
MAFLEEGYPERGWRARYGHNTKRRGYELNEY